MNKLTNVVIAVALLCMAVAITIKFTSMGSILPGRLPFNWAKLADTFLLLSIALSLRSKK